jgi:hypothetical protein
MPQSALPQAGTTHYVVVDGYYHASGEYAVSITCNDCRDGNATLITPENAVADVQAVSAGADGGSTLRPGDGAASPAAAASAGRRRRLASHTLGANLPEDPLSQGRGSCAGGVTADGTGDGSTLATNNGIIDSSGGEASQAFSATGRGAWAQQGGPGGCSAGSALTTQGAQHGVDTPAVFAVDAQDTAAGGAGAGAAGGIRNETLP